MNTYLTQANELFHLSRKELNKAKRDNNVNLARDASGKAWIATTDAFKGFLLLQGISVSKLPKSERQRHDLLAQYGDERMWELYTSIMGEIHQNAYYEGMIIYPILFLAFNNVKKFIIRCSASNF